MKKVIVIGEVLIDFIPREIGCDLKEVTTFTKAPGGAPANVAACVTRLGGKAKVLSKLGEDAFGTFLIEAMQQVGIDTSSVLTTNKANTALAFVSLKEDGERDFAFYRKPSADMLLEANELCKEDFEVGDILHFCSVDLVDAPVRKAHDRAIEIMKAKDGLISFDPNVRLPLWEDHKEYQEVIQRYIPHADILKVSEDELTFITGISDEDKALEWLCQQVSLVIYTKGGSGATILNKKGKLEVPCEKIKAVDTTGAGDSFIGALLAEIQRTYVSYEELRNMEWTEENRAKWLTMTKFAHRTAAIVVGRKGALYSMPTRKEVDMNI